MDRAKHLSMKNTNLFTILLVVLWSAIACLPVAGQNANDQQTAGPQVTNPQPADQKVGINVNERYLVEGIAFRGFDESKISKSWHAKARKLVGEKYSERAARDLAMKLAAELKSEYKVEVKVEKGQKPDHVKVVFHLEKIHRYFHRNAFDSTVPLVVYHSKHGFSGTLEIPIDFHHNVFTFGLVSDADQLLERNAGFRLRYEHRKLGTEKLLLRIDFNGYHQSFNPATLAALEQRPDVPDFYRARQNFAPSLSVHPTKELMLRAGVSFQRLQLQYPTLHTEMAYAGIADIRYLRDVESKAGYWQRFGVDYGLRTATRVLDSDYVYTRHRIKTDYVLSKGKHLLGAHFLGGLITGNAPLFERFSLGNSTTLRGWNKFDVAPLGGNRAAHGSLEYRYEHFQIFYDVGAVWDSGRSSQAKHGIGFGFVSKSAFISLAFPVRLDNVVPIFMFGIRY
jgi:hypothetical protein